MSFISVNGLAQNTADDLPRMQVVSAYVLAGAATFSSPAGGLTDFRKLAPGSDILNQDFGQFDDNGNGMITGGVGFFTPAIGIRINHRDGTVNNHFLMRAGITYSGGDLLYDSRYYSMSTPYDTLISTRTGEEIYRDSIYSKSVDMTYRASFLQIDVSLLWSTGFDKHFQLYGGVGLAAGGSFNARTSISQNEYSYGSYREYRDDSYGGEYENFRNKSGFSGSLYLPLGLDLRLGKKGIWRASHFVVELRPGLAFVSIPEVDSYVSPSFGSLWGIKVGW